MQASQPDRLMSTAGEQQRVALQTERHRVGRKLVGINPWVVICVLALVGWSVDSLLVSLEIHRLDGGDFRAHLTHFWYGPPVLLALLLLLRKALPKAALWAPRLTAASIARCGRRSGVKRLADQLSARPSESKLLGVLMRYSSTAMSETDLGAHASQSETETKQALLSLSKLGLIEEVQLLDARFYRLTRQPHRRKELQELQEWDSWHREWQVEADRTFSLAGQGSEVGR